MILPPLAWALPASFLNFPDSTQMSSPILPFSLWSGLRPSTAFFNFFFPLELILVFNFSSFNCHCLRTEPWPLYLGGGSRLPCQHLTSSCPLSRPSCLIILSNVGPPRYVCPSQGTKVVQYLTTSNSHSSACFCDLSLRALPCCLSDFSGLSTTVCLPSYGPLLSLPNYSIFLEPLFMFHVGSL